MSRPSSVGGESQARAANPDGLGAPQVRSTRRRRGRSSPGCSSLRPRSFPQHEQLEVTQSHAVVRGAGRANPSCRAVRNDDSSVAVTIFDDNAASAVASA